MEATVFDSPSLRILDFRCEAAHCGLSAEEEAGGYEIVLPRRGMFVRHVERRSVVGDPNHALFFNHGEVHRVSHPAGGGDHCTVLVFPASEVRDGLSAVDPASAEAETRLFRHTHTPTSPRVHLLHRRLMQELGASSDALAVEEAAFDIFAQVVTRAVSRAEEILRTARRASTRVQHDEVIRATQRELALRLSDKLRLRALATVLDTSPHHLSRLFRQNTGLTLAAYHRRLRLRAALDLLIAGEEDLSRLALEFGFSDHSHFSNAFRAEFGATPSTSRRSLQRLRPRDDQASGWG
jgi:AraC-like DNA-binding protein